MEFHQHQEVCHKLKCLLTLMPSGCCQLRLKTKRRKDAKHQNHRQHRSFQRRMEKMTKEAEAHATEDAEKRRGQIDAKNAADSLIFTAEKAVKEAGDKAPGWDQKGSWRQGLQLWKAFWTLVQRPILKLKPTNCLRHAKNRAGHV